MFPKVKSVKMVLVVGWKPNVVLVVLLCRTSAGSELSSRIHPENVPRAKPRQGEDAVSPLHLRHRHREHPLRLRGRQGHHPAAQPKGVQPRVAAQGRE